MECHSKYVLDTVCDGDMSISLFSSLKNSRVRHEVHGIEVAVKEGAMAPMLGARVLWDVAVDNDRRK